MARSLQATWTWAPALLSDTMVHDLAQRWFRALGALVAHAAQPGAGGRTPGDLPLVALTQHEIEEIERHYPRIDDILPLAPLQEGLLFHALYDAQAPDVYTIQLELALEGALDAEALTLAATRLIERHANLRAGFRQAGHGRPVQVIVPEAAPRWTRIDLTMLHDGGERTRRLDEIATAERATRFDLAAPPLLRLALVRLGGAEHRLILTGHHILMDGWSLPVLVRELFTLYGEARDPHRGTTTALPRPTPYRDYLAWIAAQDRTSAETAWRHMLAGLEGPTFVAPRDASRTPVLPEQISLALSEELTAR